MINTWYLIGIYFPLEMICEKRNEVLDFNVRTN
jgi:hypothetical protein